METNLQSQVLCRLQVRIATDHGFPTGDEEIPWRKGLDNAASYDEAGLEAGNRTWVSIPKTNYTYYATLQFLPTVDPARAIQIGVHAYQNLAVLHYMQLEYEECDKCLQHPQNTVEKGVAQSLLDDAVLGKVKWPCFSIPKLQRLLAVRRRPIPNSIWL